MDEHIKRIHYWIMNKKEGPVQIQLHLTNFCNLKCFFCPTRTLIDKSRLNPKNELTTDAWLTIIKQGEELNVKEWHICGGGEPFFFKDKAVSVIHKIKELHRHCEIITNGTLFDEEMIRNFVQIDVDKITFSIDGSHARIHESIRGVSCFDMIKDNLKLFCYWKKKLHKNKPRIAFHVVMCNKNYRNLEDIVKLAQKTGAEDVLINALNIWSDKIKALELHEKQKTELKSILVKADKYARKHTINTNIPEFIELNLFDIANVMDKSIYVKSGSEKSLLNAACFMPWYNMSVFSDGECKPCFILKQQGPSLKKDSLKSIWQGDFFNTLRNDMISNKMRSDCSKCNPWSFYKNKEIRKELRKTYYGRTNQ